MAESVYSAVRTDSLILSRLRFDFKGLHNIRQFPTYLAECKFALQRRAAWKPSGKRRSLMEIMTRNKE